MIFQDTIAAIATPLGVGGIGVIRISGKQAYPLACKLLRKTSLKPRYAYYGEFIDPKTQICIDQGLVLYFKGSASFTGEDVIELQGHGGLVIMQRLLKLVLSLGARQAEPGEFSKRAFLNGKIDLLQAEAIADLIHAQSEQAAAAAIKSLQGRFSQEVDDLYNKIKTLRIYVEASLDFPDEEIDFYADGKILKEVLEIKIQIKKIKQAAQQGIALQEGHSLGLIGKPNVGKSKLINVLVQQDISIVTQVAGTTRDVIKADCLLQGLPVQIIDTAGLRHTTNIIEQEGIKRTKQVINQVEVVLLLIDATQHKNVNEFKTIADLCAEYKIDPKKIKQLIVCRNKIDLTTEQAGLVQKQPYNIINISALTGAGIADLQQSLVKMMSQQGVASLGLARVRHLDAIDKTLNVIVKAYEQLNSCRSLELLAEDLKQAQDSLAVITGKVTADELLGDIFSNFCIGK